MTTADAVARQADHENLTTVMIHALQRADAELWVQERLHRKDHSVLRAEIKAALDRAYKEIK